MLKHRGAHFLGPAHEGSPGIVLPWASVQVCTLAYYWLVSHRPWSAHFFFMAMIGTKRVYAGKRNYQSKKGKGTSLRTEVFRLKKQIAAQRNLGRVDVIAQQDVADTSGEITLLNGIAEGTNDDERLGNQITMRSIRYMVHAAPDSAQVTWQKAAWYLIYDRQPNGAIPVVADVLSTDSSDAFPAWDNKQRFQILKKELFLVAPFDEGGPPSNIREGYIKLNHVTRFDGVGANIGDMTTGSLFSLGVGNTAAGSNANPVMFFSTRIVFDQ